MDVHFRTLKKQLMSHKRRTKTGTQETTAKQSSKIIMFNKPYGVLCQFSADGNMPTLADYIVAPHYYPAGRLDKDSEGLLILTANGKLQHRISHPDKKLHKTYWVQVEGEISQTALESLRTGVSLKDGLTKPAHAKIIECPASMWPRNPPIRERKNIPTNWIELSIREGKNRQVRRMTAAVGFPTLRLIRSSIGKNTMQTLQPGQWVYCDYLA
jgi:23S rRNA pseudouridine2457 synthase